MSHDFTENIIVLPTSSKIGKMLFALYNEQILPSYLILEGLLVSVVVECASKVVANVLNNVL